MFATSTGLLRIKYRDMGKIKISYEIMHLHVCYNAKTETGETREDQALMEYSNVIVLEKTEWVNWKGKGSDLGRDCDDCERFNYHRVSCTIQRTKRRRKTDDNVGHYK